MSSNSVYPLPQLGSPRLLDGIQNPDRPTLPLIVLARTLSVSTSLRILVSNGLNRLPRIRKLEILALRALPRLSSLPIPLISLLHRPPKPLVYVPVSVSTLPCLSTIVLVPVTALPPLVAVLVPTSLVLPPVALTTRWYLRRACLRALLTSLLIPICRTSVLIRFPLTPLMNILISLGVLIPF